jgi:hypothetical protein
VSVSSRVSRGRSGLSWRMDRFRGQVTPHLSWSMAMPDPGHWSLASPNRLLERQANFQPRSRDAHGKSICPDIERACEASPRTFGCFLNFSATIVALQYFLGPMVPSARIH